MHNLRKELPLVRDKGTIGGSLSVEFNDLTFELTEEERIAIGGNAQTSETTPTTTSANHNSSSVAGAGGFLVGGLTNQMEGLNVDSERSPERPASSSPHPAEQPTRHQREAAAVVGAAGLLEAVRRAPNPPPHSPTPPPPQPPPTQTVSVYIYRYMF